MAHGVVRTDLLAGTDVRSELASVRFQTGSGASAANAAIDNGNVVKLGDLEDGSRTVYIGTAPSASDTLGDIVLIASPEVMYDERLKDLDDYYNEAGKISRGYRLHEHDIFSVTIDALDITLPQSGSVVGYIVELQSGTKLKAVSSATSGSTAIGKIIDVNVVGKYTYYVIEID